MTKILAVQQQVGKMKKDQAGYNNRYKFFDINQLLDQLQPLLSENGLVVIQPLTHVSGVPAIKTIVMETDSGETLEETIPFSQNPDPQKVGSCITYYRRYALQSLFALQSEDDDGSSASSPPPTTPPASASSSGSTKPAPKKRFGDPQFAKFREVKDQYSKETAIAEIQKRYQINEKMKKAVLSLYE